MPTPPTGRDAIAEHLRSRIETGDYGDGGFLANSEKELAESYGVNRLTARAALTQLRSDGLVETRKGKGRGIFATPWRPIPRNSPQRLSAEQWGEGRAIWDLDLDDREYKVDGVVIEQLPAPEDVARALGVEPGSLVWRRARSYLIDGRTVQHATSHLPAGLVEGSRITQVDTGPGGIHARLRELGHEPVRHREELRLRTPAARDRELLKLTHDTPVLDIVRVSWDASGRAVEHVAMLLDGSRFVLGYDF